MFDLQGYGGLLMRGLWLTVKLFGVSLLFGLVFGLIGAACKVSKFAVLRYLSNFYTTVVRGIPELLFVFFVYFGGEQILRLILSAFGYQRYVNISPFWAGVVALSVMFGAYATEVFRMALGEIPKGQTEAAQSLGMKPWQTFFRIILPQMWIVALPGLGNLALVLLKDTALVSVIGLQDLMYYSARAAQSTQQAFTFYLTAALIYLGLTIVIMGAIAWLEYIANPAARYAKRMQKHTHHTDNTTNTMGAGS
ncbi:MAG: ABC transporter permease subunit [Moraxella sp.]|nr:ABC transporter permease subunit [Moraxella sp.]